MPSVFDRPPGPRRVLSIDGGGIRGALAVGILERMEDTLRKKLGRPDLVLSDYFDLIGGTSTGAIIAAGLALGRDAAYLRQLYRTLGPRVFRRSWPRLPLVQPRFDPRRLEEVIVEELGDVTLGTADWKTGFAVVAKRVDTGSSWLLTNCPGAKYWAGTPHDAAHPHDPSHHATTPNRDYLLAKVVQASAAAPFYFDMVRMEVHQGEQGVFFDGAMTPHGNPVLQLAMTAVVPAYGLGWPSGADKLMIVSVGTGAPRPVKPAWVRRPATLAIWKAIHALTSIAYDNSQLGIAVLQWLGDSPRRWPINRDVGGLENSLPCQAPLWTFVRYDAPLEAPWLETHIGERFTPAVLAKLAKLDDETQVPELFRIGQKAGAALIRADHFPDVFDPVR
jgi:hypothetical protein